MKKFYNLGARLSTDQLPKCQGCNFNSSTLTCQSKLFSICSFHLPMSLGNIYMYCKQYEPKSDCPFGIMVHTVCFHVQKKSVGIRVNKLLAVKAGIMFRVKDGIINGHKFRQAKSKMPYQLGEVRGITITFIGPFIATNQQVVGCQMRATTGVGCCYN